MKIKLTGTQGAQISTPDGMVILNRTGEAYLYKQSTVDFIAERIAAGGLAGFELEEVEKNADDDPGTGNDEGTGLSGVDEPVSKKKPKA